MTTSRALPARTLAGRAFRRMRTIPVPSSKRISLRGTGLAASFRDARVVEATGWLVETWIVHSRRCRTESIGTVDVYRHDGAWHAWQSSLSSPVRQVANRIAEARGQ